MANWVLFNQTDEQGRYGRMLLDTERAERFVERTDEYGNVYVAAWMEDGTYYEINESLDEVIDKLGLNYPAEKRWNELERQSVEELDLSVRSFNCLKRKRVNTIADLASYSVEELEAFGNMGKKSVDEICSRLLQERDISLASKAKPGRDCRECSYFSLYSVSSECPGKSKCKGAVKNEQG